jgi:hypothetical protein
MNQGFPGASVEELDAGQVGGAGRIAGGWRAVGYGTPPLAGVFALWMAGVTYGV